MNPRENILSLYRRQGYEKAPVDFHLCPSLEETYKTKYGGDTWYGERFGFAARGVSGGRLFDNDTAKFKQWYPYELKPGTHIDCWGIAREPGSEAAKHMRYTRNPLKHCKSLGQMKEYPFPDFINAAYGHQKDEVQTLHARGLAATGGMECSIWETAWYIRGMEELMMDMLSEDPMAEYLLDKITELAIVRAKAFAAAGCDILNFGDDIGMQRTIMMSEKLYTDWIKPRFTRLINEVRKDNPQVICLYHSCGYVTPFIPHLIEAGIDVLNPVQPECMDFAELYKEYGDVISFSGTLGTQTTMPFGTPDDVRRVVFDNLEIAGDRGGLLVCPTHMLEPEVPWENVEAYVKACRDFK
jgi:uroporphyrinogen decarboxylase